MKPFCTFFISIICMLVAAPSMAKELNLDGYVTEDGALRTFYKGTTIDPYFATKALFLAKQYGFDVKDAEKHWAEWMLKHQEENGLFKRYQYAEETKGWTPYADADADDVMLAYWLQLSCSVWPTTTPQLQQSVAKASQQLSKLYNKELGIYHISSTLSVGLFMDNVEIHSAFVKASQCEENKGNSILAALYHYQAMQLRSGIEHVFWDQVSETYIASTQVSALSKESFYPDKIVQIFPLLDSNADEYPLAAATYNQWIKNNRQQWLEMHNIDYPWGSLALISLNMKDDKNAFCWKVKAEPYRYGKNWNILEEVAYQIIEKKFSESQWHNDGTLCAEGV